MGWYPGYQRKRVEAVCGICNTHFQAVVCDVKRGKGTLCSSACAARKANLQRDQSGAANNNWKGGLARHDRRRRYNERHPEKAAAHSSLTKAIRAGTLERQPCEICGNARVEGHHEDYSLPLLVRWLCKHHHLEAHSGRF